MIKSVAELDLRDRTVFLRVDFNVPIDQGKITEPHRIESALPTIRLILERAKKLVIASHLGRPDGKVVPKYSLAPVREYLENALKQPVVLAPDCIGSEVERIVRDPAQHVVLLENLRFHKEEEKNDPHFSQSLAALADVYIDDAFGAAHRAHASIAGMAKFFKTSKGAGLLLKKELDYLSRVLLKIPPRDEKLPWDQSPPRRIRSRTFARYALKKCRLWNVRSAPPVISFARTRCAR